MAKRTAEDYGVQNLTDEQLQYLATNEHGEHGKFAAQELQKRRGLMAQAETYRQAVQRATYQGLSPQFEQGLGRIQGYLAGAGPAADSGIATGLRAKLAGQIYGQAQGQIGGQYSDYLGNLLNQDRQFTYQKALQQQQAKLNKPKPWEYIFGAAGGAAGAYGGAYLDAAGRKAGG